MFGHQNDVHKTESILEDRVKRITANRSRKRERERELILKVNLKLTRFLKMCGGVGKLTKLRKFQVLLFSFAQ